MAIIRDMNGNEDLAQVLGGGIPTNLQIPGVLPAPGTDNNYSTQPLQEQSTVPTTQPQIPDFAIGGAFDSLGSFNNPDLMDRVGQEIGQEPYGIGKNLMKDNPAMFQLLISMINKHQRADDEFTLF